MSQLKEYIALFINNEYTKEYLNIVSVPFDGIGEKHHILPRCMCPEHVKSSWNIVNLSYRDHYRCHELLPYMVIGEIRYKLLCAWNQMCGRTYGKFIDANMYEELKTLFSENNPSKRKDVKAKKSAAQKRNWQDKDLLFRGKERGRLPLVTRLLENSRFRTAVF